MPSPPVVWYIHISPAPRERVEVKCLRAMMYCPSADHVGLFSRRKFSFVTSLAFVPSAFIIQILSPPPASLVKAIFFPSGLKRGCCSAGNRHGINIAEQVERDCFSVGAHVEIHPRSFVDREGNIFVIT